MSLKVTFQRTAYDLLNWHSVINYDPIPVSFPTWSDRLKKYAFFYLIVFAKYWWSRINQFTISFM